MVARFLQQIGFGIHRAIAGDKYLFWRIAEEPAYVPDFEEALPRVDWEAVRRYERPRVAAELARLMRAL